MAPFSIDYAAIAAQAPAWDVVRLGGHLLDAFAAVYETENDRCTLTTFEQSGATYLFDFASSCEAAQEDRTIAAWALTPERPRTRDVTYQRGFPLPPLLDDDPVDRGHLIPHLSGGEFGPNIFRQDRALNRGWSQEGKRYRALEREAARTPGTFYFGHLLYDDDSAHPIVIEIGLMRGESLHVERFNNRPSISD